MKWLFAICYLIFIAFLCAHFNHWLPLLLLPALHLNG